MGLCVRDDRGRRGGTVGASAPWTAASGAAVAAVGVEVMVAAMKAETVVAAAIEKAVSVAVVAVRNERRERSRLWYKGRSSLHLCFWCGARASSTRLSAATTTRRVRGERGRGGRSCNGGGGDIDSVKMMPQRGNVGFGL